MGELVDAAALDAAHRGSADADHGRADGLVRERLGFPDGLADAFGDRCLIGDLAAAPSERGRLGMSGVADAAVLEREHGDPDPGAAQVQSDGELCFLAHGVSALLSAR